LEGVNLSGLGTSTKVGAKQTLIRKSGPVTWSKFPEKRVYSIEIAGEADYGKTHCVATFPKVAMADTPGEDKGWIIFKKFNNEKYLRISDFNNFRQFVEHCIKDPEIKTIAIDSGSDLVIMATKEYLEDLKAQGKKGEAVYPIFQYRHVYAKIDELVKMIKDADKYFITTCRLKDEYIGSDPEHARKSGKRIRQGYTKFYYGLTIMIQLQKGIRDDKTGTLHFPNHIFGKVVKNNFLCRRVQKPYVFNPTFQGFEDELFMPYCKNYDEVKCKDQNCLLCQTCELCDVIADARKWLQSKGLINKPTPKFGKETKD